MNSIIINEQGSHKVKGNGFWRIATVRQQWQQDADKNAVMA